MMASFSEGLLLTEKVGLDPKVLVEVFPTSEITLPCPWKIFLNSQDNVMNQSNRL